MALNVLRSGSAVGRGRKRERDDLQTDLQLLSNLSAKIQALTGMIRETKTMLENPATADVYMQTTQFLNNRVQELRARLAEYNRTLLRINEKGGATLAAEIERQTKNDLAEEALTVMGTFYSTSSDTLADRLREVSRRMAQNVPGVLLKNEYKEDYEHEGTLLSRFLETLPSEDAVISRFINDPRIRGLDYGAKKRVFDYCSFRDYYRCAAGLWPMFDEAQKQQRFSWIFRHHHNPLFVVRFFASQGFVPTVATCRGLLGNTTELFSDIRRNYLSKDVYVYFTKQFMALFQTYPEVFLSALVKENGEITLVCPVRSDRENVFQILERTVPRDANGLHSWSSFAPLYLTEEILSNMYDDDHDEEDWKAIEYEVRTFNADRSPTADEVRMYLRILCRVFDIPFE